MLPLIRTLFDIVLLRKGPESIPRAGILLVMAVGLWVFAMLAALALIETVTEENFFKGFLLGFAAVIAYAAVVVVSGHATRVLQTTVAIIGCGALIQLAFVAEHALLMPFVGETVTTIIASLILLWSIPVEGHIIARAIGQHWYIGIIFAIVVFVLQYLLSSIMTTQT